MAQDYLKLITKFYSKLTQKHKQSSLLSHTLERFLNYQLKQQEKQTKKREDSSNKSHKSESSNVSISNYIKIKKLFISKYIEASIFFQYFLNKIKTRDCASVVKVLIRANQAAKNVDKGLTSQQKNRYQSKVSKFIEHMQFLEGKNEEGGEIDWLYFQVFKEFESEIVLTAQILSSQGTLQPRQNMKDTGFRSLLTTLQAQCFINNYTDQSIEHFGSSGMKIYLGERSRTYFILTEQQFEKARYASGNREISSPVLKIIEMSPQKQTSKLRSLKSMNSLTSNKNLLESRKQARQQRGSEEVQAAAKFKEQFLLQMLKLRQKYKENTQVIANLFNFKDASESIRINDQHSQA